MKRVLLLAVSMAALFVVVSCSKPTRWNDLQRVQFVALLDPYRNMVYLTEFSDDEFVIFTDDLGDEVEVSYPVYTELVAMPALSDSLDSWVVGSIVEQLDTDAANMRYLYPYHTMVAQGVLPEGLDHEQRIAFYRCFATKVNAHFSSLDAFFYAVITNSVEPNVISAMQAECAQDLFGFTVVVDD